MAVPTFVPVRAPDTGTQDKPEFRILKADFGDGYSSYAPDGLNNIRRVMTLTWTYLQPKDAKYIVDFIWSLQGASSFWYTPSDEPAPVKWTCQDYSDERAEGGLRKVTMTIRQSFALDG